MYTVHESQDITHMYISNAVTASVYGQVLPPGALCTELRERAGECTTLDIHVHGIIIHFTDPGFQQISAWGRPG